MRYETVAKEWRNNIKIREEYNEYREAFLEILEPFQSMWDGHLWAINAANHRSEITSRNIWPICVAPHRAGRREWESEKKEIDRILKKKLIEPTQREWNSPVVFVPQKHGTRLFCGDRRKLSSITVRDCHPFPRMDEFIDSLRDAQVLFTLDFNSAYWQIEVDKEDM